MSDEPSCFNSDSPREPELLHLGYLIQNQQTHPFSLELPDLTNLFIVGTRAHDIYYTLFLQLCDDLRIPVLVLSGRGTGDFEEQVCEGPIWHLDLSTDEITFDILDLGKRFHHSRQITILIDLLEDFHPLSPSARNLLHVMIWKTLVTMAKPTFSKLQNILSLYKHYNLIYYEISRLFEALPVWFFTPNYDNISLNRIQHLPTIITGNNHPTTRLAMNLLLLKLLAHKGQNLPPLFIIDPSVLNPQLLHWLCICYAASTRPFVIFDAHDILSTLQVNRTYNYIITNSPSSRASPIVHQLSERERNIFNQSDDHVVVQLRSEPLTRIITIF